MKGGSYAPHIEEAALALSLGWKDPIAYLSLEGVELLVAKRVVQVAADRHAEREKAHWKNFVAAVANGISRAFKG